MKYEKIRPGTFLDRPNRFVAHVELGGTAAVCHVKIQAGAVNCWSLARRSIWRRREPGPKDPI